MEFCFDTTKFIISQFCSSGSFLFGVDPGGRSAGD